MINIMIADDYAIVRKGLIDIIEDENDMKVILEAKNSQEVLDNINNNDIDILILDINMPGRSGFDILSDIKAQRPKLPVLILSINSEEQYALRCLRAGASGYMNKDIEPEEFVMAIRNLNKGLKYFSTNLANRMFIETEKRPDRSDLHDSLSAREFEVLRMIVNGKKICDIAGEMSLSVKTVSTYKTRILNKLKLKTSEELIKYSIEHNLI